MNIFIKLENILEEKLIRILEKLDHRVCMGLAIIGAIPGITVCVSKYFYKKFLKKEPDISLEEITFTSMFLGLLICIIVLPALTIYLIL